MLEGYLTTLTPAKLGTLESAIMFALDLA